jgi:expansin (peptidoglycan-binding protein)
MSVSSHDDERMIIHGMLYGSAQEGPAAGNVVGARSSLDNNSNLNTHSKTAPTSAYNTSVPGKISNSSKQGSGGPLMNRSATSENAISAVNKENDSGFVHTGSSVNSAAMSM